MKYLISILLCLFASLSAHAEELLDPDEAFKVSASAPDPQHIALDFRIADGYYLYRHRFAFEARSPGLALGPASIPAGKPKHDEYFGDVETYRGTLRIVLPLTAGAADASAKVLAGFQGCADQGVCFPPTKRELGVELGNGGGLIAQALGGATAITPQPIGAAVPATNASAVGDESGRLAALLGSGHLLLILASFFGAGLLLAFTPCMLPMLPILSGIIVGQGNKVSRGRGFALAGAYVLGMAVTYALAGVAAGLSGTLLSAALQNAWVLGGFAAIFVVLALAMFGFYELQLPAALQSRISGSANAQRGGSFIGVTIMGVLSALIVGPCIAAPLAGALLYIARTGDAVLGGSALFTMALGMGLPLVLVAGAARELLPKAGPWMESVKKTFGVMLLALAIWLLGPVLPTTVFMLAWAALLIVSAVFLHALDSLPPQARGWTRFWKGIGVIALVAGVSLVLGALSGARDPLQPLAALRGVTAVESAGLQFERVKSAAELDRRLAEGRPVMLDFYADWCVSCKEMERFTFSDARVQAALGDTLLLRADVTANDDEDKALLKRFGLFGPPAILFFDTTAHEYAPLRVIGYQKTEAFLGTLTRRQTASSPLS